MPGDFRSPAPYSDPRSKGRPPLLLVCPGSRFTFCRALGSRRALVADLRRPTLCLGSFLTYKNKYHESWRNKNATFSRILILVTKRDIENSRKNQRKFDVTICDKTKCVWYQFWKFDTRPTYKSNEYLVLVLFFLVTNRIFFITNRDFLHSLRITVAHAWRFPRGPVTVALMQ